MQRPMKDDDDNNAQDNIDLKDQNQTDDVSLKMDNKSKTDEDEDKEKPFKKDNVLVAYLLKVRRFFKTSFCGSSLGTKIFWIIFLNLIALCILTASIVTSFLTAGPINWCDGPGFLWILYFLLYMGIFHYIIKKYFGQSINSLFTPVNKCCTNLMTKRYFRIFCFLTPVVILAIHVVLRPGKSGRRGFSFLGMVVFVIFGFLFSKYPSHINWRPVICGLILQFLFGLITMRCELGRSVLDCMGRKVTNFLKYSDEGSVFVYGELAKPEPGSAPIFAFSVLPVIFFISFIVNLLSHYGILQWFILKISWIVKLGMGTTVCESVNAAASIFLGMTEAPLLIKEYLKDLTKSELCAIMCAGWSTVAGVVLAAYIQFGIKASHLITASVMSAPASLSYSKLLYPETEESKNRVDNVVLHKVETSNALDAASKGATQGINVIAGIIANMVAFLAFVKFIDGSLQWLGDYISVPDLSFQLLMSKLFYPISFLMGVEEDSLEEIAYLVGVKTVANEFQAYQMLGELIKKNKISERTEIIATYALCGFSNFGSIGITLGGISSLEPTRSSVFAEVAIPAFVAANIVCFMTACVAGCLID